MLVASLYTGLDDIVRNSLLYFYKVQQPDGSFIMDNHPKSLYWELFGYTLWGWGRYYQLTRDDDFLRQVYPGVVRAMEWQKKISDADPLGLMPPSTISDDAYLKDTYQTGMNMWVLVGLKNAISLAEGMEKKDDVEHFKAQYQKFWTAFEKQLNTQTEKSGGYIPPGLNRTLLGNNWDNLLTLYPEPLFQPFRPKSHGHDTRVPVSLCGRHPGLCPSAGCRPGGRPAPRLRHDEPPPLLAGSGQRGE